MNFDYTLERETDALVLSPEGDMDVQNAAILRQVLQQVIDRKDCARVVVDMSSVTFLDSSALGVLVAARRAASANGMEFALREPGPMVRMVLEVTNLYETFVH